MEPQESSAAPGSLDAGRAGTRAQSVDYGRPLFLFLALLGVCALGGLYEVLFQQTRLYLSPGHGPPRWLAWIAALTGASLGALWVRRARSLTVARTSAWLSAAALTLACSSGALFWSFGSRLGFELIPVLVPGLVSLFTVAALLSTYQVLYRPARGLELGLRLANAFRLGVGLLAVVGGAAIAATIGSLRTAPVLGLGLAITASWSLPLYRFLFRQPGRESKFARWFSRVSFVIAAATLGLAELWVPTTDLARYPNQIVYAQRTDKQEIVFTGGQNAFEMFVDGKLKVSMIDEYRYHEALVIPALAGAKRRSRVALLGGGSGMALREILRFPDVKSVRVVIPDLAILDLARQVRWLRELNRLSVSDERVTVVEQEPAAWLAAVDAQFDVIFVDLPDPLSYADGKNYTRYFYERLGNSLAPGGIAAIQATSPLRTPRSFATIRVTLAAAGLETLPYQTAIPMFGEWGFILAARRPIHVPRSAQALPLGPRFVNGATLGDLFVPTRDAHVAPGPWLRANLLHEQHLVDLFHEERRSLRGEPRVRQ